MSIGLDTVAVVILAFVAPFQLAIALGAGGTPTRLAGAIAGALCAVCIVKHRALARRRYWSFVVALALYSVLTCLWSVDSCGSLYTVATVPLKLALYNLINVVSRIQPENTFIVRCIRASGVVVAFWVIVGWFWSDNAIVSSDLRAMSWVGGQKVDPNHVAAALILRLAVLPSSERILKRFLGLIRRISMSDSKLPRCHWAAMAGVLASDFFLGTLTASYFWLAVFFSWMATPLSFSAVEVTGNCVAADVGGMECAR